MTFFISILLHLPFTIIISFECNRNSFEWIKRKITKLNSKQYTSNAKKHVWEMPLNLIEFIEMFVFESFLFCVRQYIGNWILSWMFSFHFSIFTVIHNTHRYVCLTKGTECVWMRQHRSDPHCFRFDEVKPVNGLTPTHWSDAHMYTMTLLQSAYGSLTLFERMEWQVFVLLTQWIWRQSERSICDSASECYYLWMKYKRRPDIIKIGIFIFCFRNRLI